MGKLQLVIAGGLLLAIALLFAGLIFRPRILHVAISLLPLPYRVRQIILRLLSRTLLRVAPKGALEPLSPIEARTYRSSILAALCAAVAGGLVGGQIAGFVEAVWMYRFWQVGNPELFLFCWCVMMYGAVFAIAGVGIGAGLVFLSLAADRWLRPSLSFSVSVAITLAGIITVVGRHRYARDALGDHALSGTDIVMLLAVAGGAALAAGALFSVLVPLLRLRWRGAVVATILTYALVSVGAFGLGKYLEVPAPVHTFSPTPNAKGPNILLIMADTLRADHLMPYFAGSPAKTPNAGLCGRGHGVPAELLPCILDATQLCDFVYGAVSVGAPDDGEGVDVAGAPGNAGRVVEREGVLHAGVGEQP